MKDSKCIMDHAHKALLHEAMKKNVGLITLISMFIPRVADLFITLSKRCIDFTFLLISYTLAVRNIRCIHDFKQVQ